MTSQKYPAGMNLESFYLGSLASMTIKKMTTLMAYGLAMNAMKQDYLNATSIMPREPRDFKIPAWHEKKPYPETMRLKPDASDEWAHLHAEYEKIFLCTALDDEADQKAVEENWTGFILDICDNIKSINRYSLASLCDMAPVVTFIESVEGLPEFFKAFPWVCFMLFHPCGVDVLRKPPSDDVQKRGKMANGEILPCGIMDPYMLWCEQIRGGCFVEGDSEKTDYNYEHLYYSETFSTFVGVMETIISDHWSKYDSMEFTYTTGGQHAVDGHEIKSTFGDYMRAE